METYLNTYNQFMKARAQQATLEQELRPRCIHIEKLIEKNDGHYRGNWLEPEFEYDKITFLKTDQEDGCLLASYTFAPSILDATDTEIVGTIRAIVQTRKEDEKRANEETAKKRQAEQEQEERRQLDELLNKYGRHLGPLGIDKAYG